MTFTLQLRKILSVLLDNLLYRFIYFDNINGTHVIILINANEFFYICIGTIDV